MLSIIAACDDDNLIGVNGQLPWYNKGDLEFFKKKTLNNIVIMGRETWESIGSDPLPGRINIVLTRKADDVHLSGAVFKKSLLEALRYARKFVEKEIFIIGGEQVFKEALPLSDTIYLAKIPGSHIQNFPYPHDECYFPDIDPKKWSLKANIKHETFTFREYHRIALDW